MTFSEFVLGHTTSRERVLLLLAVPTAFLLGIWAGIWMVPPEAFAPSFTTTETSARGAEVTTAAFRPVPTYLPVLSLLVVGFSAFFAYRAYRLDEKCRDDTDPETDADGRDR